MIEASASPRRQGARFSERCHWRGNRRFPQVHGCTQWRHFFVAPPENQDLNNQIALSPRALTVALAALLSLGVAPAFAQSTTGSIFGQVPAGNGASVQIKSATGITRTVAVDDRGR
jgi:hypothetical protein